MQEIEIKRKCFCCKEEFFINKNNIDDAIYYDKKTYHSSCFIKMLNKKTTTNNKYKQKWQEVLNSLDSIKSDSYNHFNFTFVKEDLYDFIRNNYDITIVPSVIWIKLNNIYTGNLEGMSRGIPINHLLDMWKKKINMLNNIASNNIKQGKKMSTTGRINYDLSILVNKYDSYLKWLEKQKIIQAEIDNKKTQARINSDLIRNIKNDNVNKRNKDNIENIVDDIFS